MRKNYRSLAVAFCLLLITIASHAQNITLSGKVQNSITKEIVPAVSVLVKETNQGTFTNSDGEFSLTVAQLPVTLIFSSVGYDNYELKVSTASTDMQVDFKPSSVLGQEVVVAATRTPTRILESPVTIERMSNTTLRNLAAPNFYEAIANLKGVDMHTASMNFRTVTTRGFISSGNTRSIQLIDGMDNQAPGLNFPVGSVIGLTELDVANVELLPGASSALYGSGGVNGTLLISSKSPFEYQGLSYNIKQGIMHTDGKQRQPAPYYNWSFRWGQKVSDKFAFKLAGELIKGYDWQADDYRNKSLDNTGLFAVSAGDRSNPGYNGINVYGDETGVNMPGLAQLIQASIQAGVLQQTGNAVNLNNSANAYFGALNNPYPTNAQLGAFVGGFPAALQPTVQSFLPFYLGNRYGYFGANALAQANNNITRTGYEEKYLVDYSSLNAKFTGGLFYKIRPNLELSLNTYIGTGTTVYTGADRYSLKNLKMAQHKLELKAKSWFLRAYTTQENAGSSYNASAAGAFVNEAWKPTLNTGNLAGSWMPQYIIAFAEGRRLGGAAPPDAALHANARAVADAGRLIPGTAAFDNVFKQVISTPIRNGGALFLDKTDLWAGEGQLNISEAAGFSDKIEMIAGLQWKQYVLNSQGTLFADNTDTLIGYAKIPNRGNIKVNETGGYLQLSKKLLNDVLTLGASGRYDKQTNFKGRFTPRFTAVIKVAKDNNFRLSYQTAYRFPTMQNQYIALSTGTAVLIGCLPEFQTYYKLNSTLPGYTAASIVAARSGGGTAALVKANYNEVKPETATSYEIGYRGVVSPKLLVDAYLYYSQYKDFLATIVVGQSKTGAQSDLLNPFLTTNISYTQNSPTKVKALGWGIGLDYNLVKRFYITANVFSDALKNPPADLVTFFNAPKYRYNIGVRNDNVYKNIGFNVIMKWQDTNYYEGTFVKGTLPAFAMLDMQVSYRPAGTKSTFRLGGTNVSNHYYRTGFGSPYVGGLYYVSYGYNIF